MLLKRYAHFSYARPTEAAKVLRELTEQGYIEVENGAKRLAEDFV
jgi:hypothetical protein